MLNGVSIKTKEINKLFEEMYNFEQEEEDL
jgi:hypothetical protein